MDASFQNIQPDRINKIFHEEVCRLTDGLSGLQKKEPDLLRYLISSSCHRLLMICTAYVRSGYQIQRAQQCLKYATQFSALLINDSLAKHPYYYLNTPIYCSLLVSDFELAKKLSMDVLEEYAIQGILKCNMESSLEFPCSYHSVLLASCILKDDALFESLFESYQPERVTQWWHFPLPHYQMLRASLLGDLYLFENSLAESLANFSKRHELNKVPVSLHDYNSIEFHISDIDFMALGILNLNKTRNLTSSLRHKCLPTELLK